MHAFVSFYAARVHSYYFIVIAIVIAASCLFVVVQYMSFVIFTFYRFCLYSAIHFFAFVMTFSSVFS